MTDEEINLAVCNSILPRGQQHAIEKAAGYASLGYHNQAEVCRLEAKYGDTYDFIKQAVNDCEIR